MFCDPVTDKFDEVTRLSETALLSATEAFVVAVETNRLCEVSFDVSTDALAASTVDTEAACERATESTFVAPAAADVALLSATDVFSDTLRAFESATDAFVVAVLMSVLWLVFWEAATDALTESVVAKDSTLLRAAESATPAPGFTHLPSACSTLAAEISAPVGAGTNPSWPAPNTGNSGNDIFKK